MAFGLNRVELIGRLGRDPQLTYATSGQPICNFSVATDESYKDKEGERVERAEWHRVVIFGRNAENAATLLKKGGLVFVEGKLQTRKWEDKEGNTRYTTEVVGFRFISLSKDSNREESQHSAGDNTSQSSSAGSDSPTDTDGLDDLPF